MSHRFQNNPTLKVLLLPETFLRPSLRPRRGINNRHSHRLLICFNNFFVINNKLLLLHKLHHLQSTPIWPPSSP
jgi:hypothetical protein